MKQKCFVGLLLLPGLRVKLAQMQNKLQFKNKNVTASTPYNQPKSFCFGQFLAMYPIYESTILAQGKIRGKALLACFLNKTVQATSTTTTQVPPTSGMSN